MATNKKAVRTRIKRADRKNIAVGQAHIKSSFNNTIVSITDPQGNVDRLAVRRHRGLQGLAQVDPLRRPDGRRGLRQGSPRSTA